MERQQREQYEKNEAIKEMLNEEAVKQENMEKALKMKEYELNKREEEVKAKERRVYNEVGSKGQESEKGLFQIIDVVKILTIFCGVFILNQLIFKR